MVRKPHRSAPSLLPKELRPDKRVFLPASLWARLTEVADFHQAAFEEMGSSEKVSRNDIIENFLEWAEATYWDDKGGKPKSAAERLAKLKEFAPRLQAEAEAEAAKLAAANEDSGR